MNIVIIQDSGLNESLALTELISYLESYDYKFYLFLENEEVNLENSIKTVMPDLFLLPADIGGHQWAHKMSRWLKNKFKLPIITGGTYPTFYTDILLEDSNFDYIVVGEAENSMLALLQCIENNSDTSDISGVWQRKGDKIYKNGYGRALINLDDIPIPKRDIYYKYPFIRDFKLKRFSTGRGCFNKCSYCFNTNLREKYPAEIPYVRRKSVNRVIEEIKAVKNIAPIKSIHFSDDIFITKPEWIFEFAEKYIREIKIRFSCNLMLEHLNIEIIDALKAAGCKAVAVGIESGVEDIRKILGRGFSNDEAIKKAALLQKNGIEVVSFNMLALPGETLDDGLATLRLNNAMHVSNARVNLTIPLPGTKLSQLTQVQNDLKTGCLEAIKEMPDFSEGKHLQQVISEEFDFRNLLLIFSFAAQYSWFFPIANFLAKSKYNKILKLFAFQSFIKEKKFFKIDLLSGIKYFYHTGSPYKRTKNFATLI